MTDEKQTNGNLTKLEHPPDESAIALLEALLAEVRSGQIRSIVVVTRDDAEAWSISYAGVDGSESLIASLERMKLSYMLDGMTKVG